MAVRLGKRNTHAFAFVAFASQVSLVLWWGVRLVFRLREALLQYLLPLRFAAGWVFDLAVILVGMPLCALFGALQSHDGGLPIADTA